MANDFNKLIIIDKSVEQRIKDGIEKNRKGDFYIQFHLRKMGKMFVLD